VQDTLIPESDPKSRTDRNKILFYTDSREFGGHDVATLRILSGLLDSGYQIDFVFRKKNQRLLERLEAMQRAAPGLQLRGLSVPPLKYPDLAGFLYRRYLAGLKAIVSEVAPDAVFVSQGNVGISWAGLRAAHELKVGCVSYVPMARSRLLLSGFKGRLRQLLSRHVVDWPDRWLTCTQAQRQYLQEAGARQPIDILPNPIAIPALSSQKAARAANQIPADALVIGMAGRFNNAQKGCDLLVEALLSAVPGSRLRETWVLFIGDGEEREKIHASLANAGWGGRLRFTGWTDTPWEHFAALDLLVMPSRYEGQPLTMQEALLCGVPVCGTRVEGLADYLPRDWLCQRENVRELREKMESMLGKPDQLKAQLPALKRRIESENSLRSVTRRVEAALEAIGTKPDISS